MLKKKHQTTFFQTAELYTGVSISLT